MAGTRADMISRIAREIARTDLTATSIPEAIADAITAYQKERFRFSDIDPSNPPSWPTVAGRSIYTTSDNSYIQTMYKFDYLNVTVGSTVMQMTQRTPEEIHLLTTAGTQSGQPTDWAYEGNKIIVYPTPSGAWTITMGGQIRVAAPASDGEANNPWMIDAERLIRARAKYQIALHVTRNEKMQMAMSPDAIPGTGEAYRAWLELKGEANKVTGRGKIRPMQF